MGGNARTLRPGQHDTRTIRAQRPHGTGVTLTPGQKVELKIAVIKTLKNAGIDSQCNAGTIAEAVVRAFDP
jgi:hypothetical protein